MISLASHNGGNKFQKNGCSVVVCDSTTEDDAPESVPKVLVENSIDDWIEGRIDVAEPKGESKSPRLNVARRTHGR